MVPADQPLTRLLLLTGNRVPAGELERAGPERVWRAGSGRFLQGPQSEEGESLLPVRQDAADRQEEAGAVRLQHAHFRKTSTEFRCVFI